MNHYPNKPFLKWPGGKYRLCNKIVPSLPKGKTLIEPFVGAASIFLNTGYDKYVLCDINKDLINIYKTLKKHDKKFIRDANKLFNSKYNNASAYYKLRDRFNQSNCPYEKSVIFLYLNRHGYNGLCRYNLKGEYNVPFGEHKKPYFPEKEMLFFAEKSKKAKFLCRDYKEALNNIKQDTVVYCDPPYVPLSKSSNFTSYSSNKFSSEHQADLAQIAKSLSSKGICVAISNHNTTYTKKLYEGAKIKRFYVRRNISSNGQKRNKVLELLAIF